MVSEETHAIEYGKEERDIIDFSFEKPQFMVH